MDDLIRPATTRISMRFSVDGSMAACLAADRGRPYQVEAGASHLLMADLVSGLAVLVIQSSDGMRLAYRRIRDPGAGHDPLSSPRAPAQTERLTGAGL